MSMRKGSRARELTMELIVGTFVFGVLLGLGVFTIILKRENIFTENYRYRILFDDVMGLRAGDDVTIKGMSVGKVKELVLKLEGVHVTISLRERQRLRDDCRFIVVPTSVLGGRYLQIEPGTPGAPLLPPQDLYHGESPSDVFKEATALVKSVRLALEGEVIEDTSAIVEAVRRLLEEGKLTDNVQGIVADVRHTAEGIREITAKINRGEGTVGKLINDDALYTEVKNIAEEGRAILDDYRETAPIVSFSSILFGAL